MPSSLFRYEKIILLICAIISGLGISLAIGSYVYQATGVTTQDIMFYPSDPTNYLVEDHAFQLHGRYYYPRNFDPTNQYPALLLFHGVTRTMADVDQLARSMADM